MWAPPGVPRPARPPRGPHPPGAGPGPVDHGPGTVVAAPRLLSHEAPQYPERGRQFRREAVVELRVTVDASGKVTRVRAVGTPIGLGFEEAARRAAFTARYLPGLRDGVPVAMDTSLNVVFRLNTK